MVAGYRAGFISQLTWVRFPFVLPQGGCWLPVEAHNLWLRAFDSHPCNKEGGTPSHMSLQDDSIYRVALTLPPSFLSARLLSY